jgi:DNA-binding XRE family transcriptional regulator
VPKKATPTGFAQCLKKLRESAGLTQQQLAEKADLYQFSIAKLEQGVQEPTWPTVLALAKALEVDCLAFQQTMPAVAEPRGPGRPRKPAAEGPGTKRRKSS